MGIPAGSPQPLLRELKPKQWREAPQTLPQAAKQGCTFLYPSRARTLPGSWDTSVGEQLFSSLTFSHLLLKVVTGESPAVDWVQMCLGMRREGEVTGSSASGRALPLPWAP